MSDDEAGSSGPIKVDPRAWTGEIESLSMREYRAAPPEARAKYLVDGFRSGRRERLLKDICQLVGLLMLFSVFAAVRLLSGVPRAYAEQGLSAAAARATLASLLVATVALGARVLWNYLKRTCADLDADADRRLSRLRAATRRRPTQNEDVR